ncbi:2184_t:CDS:1, partial [Ambispora gerdemannii]
MAQIRSFYISNIKNELTFFGQESSPNNLRKLVTSATFLFEDTMEDIEDAELEMDDINLSEHLEVINQLDIENVVHLNDKTFRNEESDINSEESQTDSEEEIDDEEFIIRSKKGQDIFDFNPEDLVTDL